MTTDCNERQPGAPVIGISDWLGVRRSHIDLFSGIGGFACAARANNVETQIFCEQNENACNFLASAWGLTIIRDVRNFDGTKWRGVWLLTAGVPCQPASRAGKQRGAQDDRWLWPQAIRIAEESRATWLLCENPSGLNEVGLDGVLSELERIGYEVGTLEIPACAVNSAQLRTRLWIVGHAKSLDGRLQLQPGRQDAARAESSRPTQDGSLADCLRESSRSRRSKRPEAWQETRMGDAWREVEWVECWDGKYRPTKPGLCGLADGVSGGLLEALGNSIVWPIAAEVIEAMIATEARTPNAAGELRLPDSDARKE